MLSQKCQLQLQYLAFHYSPGLRPLKCNFREISNNHALPTHGVYKSKESQTFSQQNFQKAESKFYYRAMLLNQKLIKFIDAIQLRKQMLTYNYNESL